MTTPSKTATPPASSTSTSTTSTSPVTLPNPLPVLKPVPAQPAPAGMRPAVARPAPPAGKPGGAMAAAALSSSVTPPSALGQGVNTFFNEGVSTAINPGTPALHGGSQGVNYTICQSIEDVYEAINVSAGVGADDLVYAVDAKAQLVASMNISSTSVTIAIYANVITGTKVITNPSFTSGISTSDAATFFAAYGDSFVSSITTGAEYIALYTFYTSTVSEQMQLTASIKATAPTWTAMTQANLESIVNSSTTMYSMQQLITGVTGLTNPDANSMIAFANSFGTTTPNAAEIISYTTTGYENVPNPPWSTTSPVVTNRQAFLSSISQLNDLAEINNAFIDLQQLYSVYGYTDSSLATPQATLNTDLQNASKWLNGLGANPTQATTAPTYQTLTNPNPLPVPNFTLSATSMWGNATGLAQAMNPLTPFNPPSPVNFTGVSQNQVAAGVLPTSITLYNSGSNGAFCTGIQVTFSDGSSLSQGGGTSSGTLQLQAAEFVTSMSGQGPTGVFMLTFSSSNQNSVTAGTSAGSGPLTDPFSWGASAGQTFVGVNGQTVTTEGSGVWLAAISAQYVTFSAAHWTALPS